MTSGDFQRKCQDCEASTIYCDMLIYNKINYHCNHYIYVITIDYNHMSQKSCILASLDSIYIYVY